MYQDNTFYAKFIYNMNDLYLLAWRYVLITYKMYTNYIQLA